MTSRHSSVNVHGLAAALAEDDLDRADCLLSAMGRQIPCEALRPVAKLHLRRQHWCDAARLFERIDQRDIASELKHNLARNLDSIQRHRPQIYQVLMGSMSGGSYEPITAGNGQLPILGRDEAGRPLVVGSTEDPTVALRDLVARWPNPIETDTPSAFQGSQMGIC